MFIRFNPLVVAFAVFVLSIFISTLYIAIDYKVTERLNREGALENGLKKVYEREAFLFREIERAKATLITIKENSCFRKFIKREGDGLKNTEELLLSFAKSNSSIMQVRFIAKDGDEIIRIDRDRESYRVELIDKSRLQNKAHRYYFQEAMKSRDGEFYISKLDLNVEHNRVEKPFNPTFRVATPIFEGGELKGTIILNYFADELLSLFLYAPLYNSILFDQDGFILQESSEKFNWSGYREPPFKVSSILENSEELQQALKENIFRNGSFVTKELNVTFKNRLYLLLRLSDSFEEKQKKQLFEKSYYLGVFLTVVSLLISISTYFVSRNFKRTNLLANIDKLTGLYNRRMIDTKFDDAFNSCLKLGSSLSCMIIDIDHFKKINDNYGHQVGDSTLVELSKILMSETRKIDIVGRWGGEEFIIIASRTDIELAKKLSERVRVAVENHTFKDVGNITVSIGVSSVDFSSKEDETIDKVVERADNALYVAKENGRNRVEVKI